MLESKAKSGDKMAKTFWVEHLANDALLLQNSRQKGGDLPQGIEDKDIVASLGQMGYHLTALMQDPSNAMAGYLWGLTQAASIYGGGDEPIVAGIRLAGLRGDERAAEFEREFRTRHPNLDESQIDTYFRSGQREMEIAITPRRP